MKINVTKLDIAKGKRNHCYACPIARAVNRVARSRKLNGQVTVLVNNIAIGAKLYLVPEAAYQFMNRFDNGGTPKPFKFDLVPLPSL